MPASHRFVVSATTVASCGTPCAVCNITRGVTRACTKISARRNVPSQCRRDRSRVAEQGTARVSRSRRLSSNTARDMRTFRREGATTSATTTTKTKTKKKKRGRARVTLALAHRVVCRQSSHRRRDGRPHSAQTRGPTPADRSAPAHIRLGRPMPRGGCEIRACTARTLLGRKRVSGAPSGG